MHDVLLPFSCEAVFFMDNGRELYGFGCAAELMCRASEFVGCAVDFDSFGQDSLSELVLSPSAAAAESLTKQICRFLPIIILNIT